jgi:hypothetical protein
MREPEAGEARVLVLGEPATGPDPLVVGSLLECATAIAEMTPEQQAEVCIWTDGRVYSAEEALELLAQPEG